MARFSTKHKDREKTFFIKSFNEGLNEEVGVNFLPKSALSKCKNMKYTSDKSIDGETIVILSKRQGTQVITNTAHSASILACTYYIAQSKYIIADDSKVYYHSVKVGVPEIGSISGTPTFTEFKGKLIIHDSGTTKAWDGTTFETLNCLYEDEILGTGDNTETQFTGTLANLTVKPASLTITYTDTTTKTITSTAGGALEGDVDGGGTNTINYTTGAYDFTCSGAPDNTTSIYATYEKVGGAPKSKDGFVRASRLYVWGDSDYPSRIWYSGPNDEDGWDTSSSGGYLDVNPLDGQSLVGCLNFFDNIICIKDNTINVIKGLPGDTYFRVEPLLDNTGSTAYRTCINDGGLLAFLSKEGYITLTATEDYGDVSKKAELSSKFRSNVNKFTNQYCYAEYNQIDRQIWLTLFRDATQLDYLYCINLATGGQVSLYEFNFGHTCYKYVNGEMLIGGSGGHLYKLFDGSYSRYKDNGVSYSSDTFVRGCMTNWGAGFNRKHNKKIFPNIFGKAGTSCTLNLYTNNNYNTPILTETLTTESNTSFIFEDGQDVYIYDMNTEIGAEDYTSERGVSIDRKFNYKEVMYELTDIDGALGFDFYGIDFHGAIIGD